MYKLVYIIIIILWLYFRAFSSFEFQQKLIEKSEKQDASGFTLSDEGDIPLVDFTKYETRRFHDSQGREIAVFDGLVDRSDLDALRLFLLHYNSAFAYQPFDGMDEEHDNVSWIAMLKVNKIKSIHALRYKPLYKVALKPEEYKA